MKALFLAASILLGVLVTVPVHASEMPKPESIAEKMSFKLVRGVANFATSIVELPKQTILTGRKHGTVGYVLVGPIKGVGMTLYRAFIGVAETAFFLVPQPGYYDPMMEPEFVWQGWEEQRTETMHPAEDPAQKEPAGEPKSGTN